MMVKQTLVEIVAAALFMGCCFLPTVSGSAMLVPRLSTASCTGHLSNLVVTSATCDYSEEGCTFGSRVFVTGQVQADADLPRPMEIHVAETFPNWFQMGVNVKNFQVNDLCSSGVLTPPENEDAGYYCPEAGLYNFHFSFDNFGSRRNLFSSWHGYRFGLAVHFKHEGGGQDYATCHLNVKVQKPPAGSYLNMAAFVSVATLGVAALMTRRFIRRRRERLANSDEDQEYNRENKGTDMTTNFELVQDSATV